MNIKELEATLLDQIEKLNDDSIADSEETCRALIERSNAMSDLTNSYIGIQRLKLDVVKTLENNGGLYEEYLGIDVALWVVPHSVGPRFPGPLLIRTRCPDTSPNSRL